MPTTSPKKVVKKKETTKITKNKITFINGYSHCAVYFNNDLIYSYANSEVYDVLEELSSKLDFIFEDKNWSDYFDDDDERDDFPNTLAELGRRNIFEDAKELDENIRNKASCEDGYGSDQWYIFLGIGENEFIVYATHKKSGYLQTLLKEGFKGRKVVYKYSVKKVS